MKTTTQMTLVEIDKLIPYINNARTHSKEQINKLRSSLREFGFINPVIIGRDYGIIAGHGRVMAAREEGISEVPCVFVDHLTEAQKKAYIIADNRMALDAGWDEELLKVEIEALQAEAFDISLTGFGDDELSDLFGLYRIVSVEAEREPYDHSFTAVLSDIVDDLAGVLADTDSVYRRNSGCDNAKRVAYRDPHCLVSHIKSEYPHYFLSMPR